MEFVHRSAILIFDMIKGVNRSIEHSIHMEQQLPNYESLPSQPPFFLTRKQVIPQFLVVFLQLVLWVDPLVDLWICWYGNHVYSVP